MAREWQLVSPDTLRGKAVTRIRRIAYVFHAVADEPAGPLELAFTDGSTLVLDAGPDGDSLAVKDRAWVDPFAEPLSSENRQYVAESGKWAAFDVSATEMYRGLIGQSITRVEMQTRRDGALSGLVLTFPSGTLRAVAECDELQVYVLAVVSDTNESSGHA